jgi:hypothetical protein
LITIHDIECSALIPEICYTNYERLWVSVQVNKEDLLNMVRYGAELVFSSEAANITDAGRAGHMTSSNMLDKKATSCPW